MRQGIKGLIDTIKRKKNLGSVVEIAMGLGLIAIAVNACSQLFLFEIGFGIKNIIVCFSTISITAGGILIYGPAINKFRAKNKLKKIYKKLNENDNSISFDSVKEAKVVINNDKTNNTYNEEIVIKTDTGNIRVALHIFPTKTTLKRDYNVILLPFQIEDQVREEVKTKVLTKNPILTKK